jgi:hypothetical protein
MGLIDYHGHTVTATVTQGGDPVTEGTVIFTFEGDDDFSHSEALDETDGTAEMPYWAFNPGVDTITATLADTEISAEATKTWVPVMVYFPDDDLS